MSTTIDNLEIKIAASAPDAAGAIDRLVTSLSGMKSSLKGGVGSLNTISKQIDKVGDSLNKFNLDRLERLRDVLSDLKGVGKVDVGVKTSAATIGSQVTSTAKPSVSSEIIDEGKGAEGAENAAEAMGDAEKSAINYRKALSALTAPIKNFVKSSKGFISTLARIGKLMLIRSAIRAFIKGLQEGIKNLRAWSETTNKTFAKSMKLASDSMVNFKNSLAVMVAPLINWLVPYLEIAIRKIMEFANAVANMFAALTGKGTFDAVIWGAEQVGEAAGSAKKKLKDLLGFDEINRLSGDTGGGGGSSSGWSGDFEERETDLEAAHSTLGKILGVLAGITALKIWKYLPLLKTWFAPLKKVAGMIGDIQVPLGPLAAAFALIASIILSLKNHWSDWVDLVKKNWEDLGLSKKFESISNSLKRIYDAIKPIIELIGSIVGVVSGVVGFILDLVGSSIIGGIIPVVLSAITGIVTTFEWVFEGIAKIVEGIKLLFSGKPGSLVEGLLKIFGGLLEILCAPFAGLWEFVKGIITTIQNAWEKMNKFLKDTYNKYIVDPINKVIDVLNKIFGLNIGHLKHLVDRFTSDGGGGGTGKGYTGYQEYAAGGFPSMGQMFVAREAGPELVGTIGGRSAVATNNDIVAAVSQGVASAVASVMGSGSTGQNIAVNVDGRNLFNIMVNQNNAYVRQTGASPLLV